MRKEEVEKIVSEYINPIFSYVCRRVSHEEDRQDLTQEICLRLYQSLCLKEIDTPEKYVWVVAKHCLVNYYRKKGKEKFISVESMPPEAELTDGSTGLLERMVADENVRKLQSEIAYLSKIQRQIVIQYYFEEKKQSEIAASLKLPLGTVKWHINEAKQQLKKGMETMREVQELKFNPITFDKVGMCGSTGEMGSASNMFHSSLSQNIIYAVYRQAKSINEIAEALAVSPVYVESELEFLEEMSLVIRDGKKYLANILIDDDCDEELLKQQEQLYEQAAGSMAIRMYDFVQNGGYLKHPDFVGPADENLVMWSLIFYLLTWNANHKTERITFEEAADIRADGGCNIIQAVVENETVRKHMEKFGMDKFCGPCWNEYRLENKGAVTLWLCDGDWTEKRVTEHYGGPNIARDLELLIRFCMGETLLPENYAYLLQKNYIRREGDKFVFAIPVLRRGEVQKELLDKAAEIRNHVMEEYKEQIESYKKAVLKTVPAHMRIQQEYFLQNMFSTDGWLVLFARKKLVEEGRLCPLQEEEKVYATQLLLID